METKNLVEVTDKEMAINMFENYKGAVAKKLATICRKFGINTTFNDLHFEKYSHSPKCFLCGKSEDFVMSPSVFSKVCIKVVGNLYAVENKDGELEPSLLKVGLDWSYDHFNRGSNGCDLCSADIQFRGYVDSADEESAVYGYVRFNA